jgi:hypothetical protein
MDMTDQVGTTHVNEAALRQDNAISPRSSSPYAPYMTRSPRSGDVRSQQQRYPSLMLGDSQSITHNHRYVTMPC